MNAIIKSSKDIMLQCWCGCIYTTDAKAFKDHNDKYRRLCPYESTCPECKELTYVNILHDKFKHY